MVVYEKTSRFAFRLLNESKSKVRISENSYKNGGNLQEEPMKRALDALRDFMAIAASYKARKILCVATSARRDAPNKGEFLKRARSALGLNIKVIEGKKEALYGGIAAANLLPPQESAMTVDIGGGSTEFCILQGREVIQAVSVDLGAVRLKELFFDKGKIKEAQNYIDEALDSLEGFKAADTIIGIGGSFRALALALMQQEHYPLEKIHAYRPSFKRLKKLLNDILEAKSPKELRRLGIKEERLDVIAPGALILLRIIKKFSIKSAVASGVGVREGVYLSDILRNASLKFPHNFNPSVRHLLDSYIKEKRHAKLLEQLAGRLFDLLQEPFGLKQEYRYHTMLAARLYPVGSAIHYYSKNKHSYYIIQATLEYGFYHDDTMLVATLARYAKRKLPSKEHYQKYAALLPPREMLDILSLIVSIAVALLVHRPCRIEFSLRYEGGCLYIITQEGTRMHLSQEAIAKLDFADRFDILFL